MDVDQRAPWREIRVNSKKCGEEERGLESDVSGYRMLCMQGNSYERLETLDRQSDGLDLGIYLLHLDNISARTPLTSRRTYPFCVGCPDLLLDRGLVVVLTDHLPELLLVAFGQDLLLLQLVDLRSGVDFALHGLVWPHTVSGKQTDLYRDIDGNVRRDDLCSTPLGYLRRVRYECARPTPFG